MKAMQINEFGGPEVMKFQDVADPTPGEGEAVVEIQAAGVNFTEVYSRQGVNPGPPLPRTIGVEGAGIVKTVAPDDEELVEATQAAAELLSSRVLSEPTEETP